MDIFECKDTMSPRPEGVVKVAQCSEEAPYQGGRLPGQKNNPEMAVRNVIRPRFGHGY